MPERERVFYPRGYLHAERSVTIRDREDSVMTRARAIEGDVRQLLEKLGADVRGFKFTSRTPKPAFLADMSDADDETSDLGEK